MSLINTRHVPDGDDVLSDDRALDWLAHQGAGGDQTAPADLESLRRLREGLRQLALANNGQQPDLDILDRARAAMSATHLSVRLGDQLQAPTLRTTPDAGAAQQVIARVITAYSAERARGSWNRIKACAAPDCQFAYIDTSRNASRRWCDMANCGNRMKNRTWRARQGTARS